MVARIAPTTGTIGHALGGIVGVLAALTVVATAATSELTRVADRRRRERRAIGVVGGIAQPALTFDALLPISRSIAALHVVAAWPTREIGVITDRPQRRLYAGNVVVGIAGATSPVDAFVEISRVVDALGVRSAGAANMRLVVAYRIGAVIWTTCVVGRIAGATGSVGHALVGIVGVLAALAIVTAAAALELTGITHRRVRERCAGCVIGGIARSAEPCHAPVAAARTVVALPIVAAWPTGEVDFVADRSGRVLAAGGVIGGITKHAAIPDALVAQAGPIGAIHINLARAARVGLVVTDRRGTLFMAPCVVGRIADPAAPVGHALVGIVGIAGTFVVIVAAAAGVPTRIANRCLREGRAVRIIGRIARLAEPVDALLAGAGPVVALRIGPAEPAHKGLRIADGIDQRLLAGRVIVWIARAAAPVDTLIAAPRPFGALAVLLAGPAGERGVVADGRSPHLGAARLVRGIAGFTGAFGDALGPVSGVIIAL